MSDAELAIHGVPDPAADGGARGPRRPMRLTNCDGVCSGASMQAGPMDKGSDTLTQQRGVLVGLN